MDIRTHSLIRRLLVATAVAGWLAVSAAGCTRFPADDSAEAGFARDMATHHDQAVEMAFILLDATRDDALRALATDIIVTQSAQRGMFMAWLQQWGLPQAPSGPRMAWMEGAGTPAGSSGHDMSRHDTAPGPPLMTGMASGAELDALRAATGRDAEVMFLQLMIRHHEGGVAMAKALLEKSRVEEVVSVVRNIESGQAGEIETMTAMLAERGARP
jgi:uncharacterized protein (DUF305 family)